MGTRLTQGAVNKVAEVHEAGAQVYDADVSGLRIVVGSKSSSYKLVGRINDGSDRYVSIIIGRTDEVSLRTARERATELKLALRRGEDPRRPTNSIPTLRQAWERYRETRGPELQPRSLEWYRDKVEGTLKSVLEVPLDKLDREAVRALHERITKRNGPYCANGAMRAMKALYNDAARTHDLPPNPVSRAVRMNKESPRQWAVGAEEMPELWRKLNDLEDPVRAACWETMLLTGLRSHDAKSMRWEHLDADGVLTVPSPKGGEARAFQLPLPRRLLQALERVKQETAPLESPFVFPSSTSRSGHVEELRRTEEFPYAPHQMRHTFRTWALEAGVDLAMTMVLMNHKPSGVTWNYVTRANLLGPMREAIERVCTTMERHR